ncbi:MAG: porin [Cyclobacteriaceae bacterium]|nr:porin [Cyclobacteriaceae bacterium]
MKVLLYFFCLLMPLTAYAQRDSSQVAVTVDAFADGYFVYSPKRTEKEILYPFLYNYNRNRSLKINHTWIKLTVQSARVRANLALQAGTYVQDNYASEPDWAKPLLEANLGLAINKYKTLWLDVGIIPSHIGFEGAGTLTNYTLTRSLIAENSPYYLNGAKLTWAPSPKWELALLGFNGWQRIYESGRILPAGGWQIKHQQRRSSINWSTFVGAVQVESSTMIRFFNNVYYQVKLTSDFSLIADVDFGVQKVSNIKNWWGAALLARYAINEKFSAACRAEYYTDKHGLVIGSPDFTTYSFSVNADYNPIHSMKIRAEFRRFVGQQSLTISKPDASTASYFSLSVLAQVNVYKSDK